MLILMKFDGKYARCNAGMHLIMKNSVNIFKDGWMGQNLNYEKIFKKLRFLLKFK